MKKIISLTLALTMILSLSVTAFASETGVEAGDYSTDVTGTYVAGTTGNGTVTPGGSLPANTESQKIGTITVTIDQDTDVTRADVETLYSNVTQLTTDMRTADLYDSYADDIAVLETAAHSLTFSTLSEFEAGNATQEDLNSRYYSVLDNYYNLKAKAGL